ncbi:hypothetical protein BV25DRAFT_1922392 [Artomyces pyxidatus]|uniref:Uncharacterized protein n=1 Tax=Artomyces pyxidatus TaxID=48021 RepID=A0ACB8SEK4_9AGAM|nr:hypothetical protein BV25DRAFT_1922392 [Artomyces pyxidatus]
MSDVLAARRQDYVPEDLSAEDCMCLSVLRGSEGQWWVSSPNMQFVPTIPTHNLQEDFGYYADGMLGPFEHLKWPQPYDGCEPHALAAPANPDLLKGEWNATPVDGGNGRYPLAKWSDDGAVWFSFSADDWKAQEDLPDCGLLDRAVAKRLRAAAREAVGRVEEVIQRFSYTDGDVVKRYTEEWEKHFLYTAQQITALNRALYTLKRHPMSLVNTLQWFREA